MEGNLRFQSAKLRKMILAMAALIEQAADLSILAVHRRDRELASRVIAQDRVINQAEIDIEEDCLNTLALFQPVASDVRFLVSILKINNDMERIGDIAVNVAEAALLLADEPPLADPPFDLSEMGQLVRGMLRASVDALVDVDAAAAERLGHRDDLVDRIHSDCYPRLIEALRRDSDLAGAYLTLVNVCRNLERMADHAVNIAENVAFIAGGEDARVRT